MAKSRHWTEQVADRVEQQARRHKGAGATIVCASGVSPSGPIHLGNLREVMTVHLVSEELRSRGWNVDHIHSWDDFDRLRKIPAGAPEEFGKYVGNALSDVPDPWGEYESYAIRYMTIFEQSIEQIGVRPRYIRQSLAYRVGAYIEQIRIAMERRFEIFDILAEYQTLGRHEKPVEERRAEYFPFRVYCENCGKDETQIKHYENEALTIHYVCQYCGNQSSFSLRDKVQGKLVWKVDWPMRWKFEGVDFEPAGEDHSAPGSSATVGQKIIRQIFDGTPPFYVGYAFVGMAGRSKLSSSAGSNATPASALEIFEPGILRWLYIRRNVGQAFDVDYGQEALRLYDEWDTFVARVREGKANEAEQRVYELCLVTSAGPVANSKMRVPFRLLSSAADITQGNVEQILRIVSSHLENGASDDALRVELEPRLSCAIRWALNYLPEDERTHIRAMFDTATYATLGEDDRRGIQILVENLDKDWSLAGLTKLVYGVPKLLRGLPLDAPPDEELKRAQRSFFVALYSLLCGSDTGPRLPTLFLSIGKERARKLLTPLDE
jgi:lysyl-tRNA synthetase class 1